MTETYKKSRAWVVRWFDVTKDVMEGKLIGIFDPRISGERMRLFVEAYFMVETSRPSEMLRYAKRGRLNPDRAHFLRNPDGVQCEGYVACGHCPRVLATIVKDLVVERSEDGSEHVSWIDVPMPRAPQC